MRSLLLTNLALSLLLAVPIQAAAPDTASTKRRATQASQAKRSAEACPLFAQVAKATPSDGWAWNQLALCRIQSEKWSGIVDPLFRALHLAREVEDLRLDAAVQTHANRLGWRLLAVPRFAPAQVRLIEALIPDDEAEYGFFGMPGCRLLKKARTDAPDALSGEGWGFLARCLADEGPSNVAVRTALEAARRGATNLGGGFADDPPGELVPNDFGATCRRLEGPACGRSLLRCWRTVEKDPSGAGREAHVVIEAASLSEWRVAPFEAAPEAVFFSAYGGAPNCYEGADAPSAHGDVYSERSVLAFDACARTYVRWEYASPCRAGDDGEVRPHAKVTEETFQIASPPPR